MAFGFDPLPETDGSGRHHPEPWPAGDSGVPVDLHRQEDRYILNADLPGIDPGSLEVSVEGRLLTISAHRTLRDLTGTGWLVRDRRRGTVQRQVLLDGGINTAGISMQYNCGVLSLDLPVDPEHRTRKIPVQMR